MDINSIPDEYLPLYRLIVNGIIPLFATCLPLILILLISRWKIYKKAGQKGWANLIPIYSDIVLLQIAKLPAWYILLYMVPLVNIYIIFKVHIELAHQFGKSTGFGVATVFFGIICFPILAFGKKCIYGGNVEINNQNKVYQQSNPIPSVATQNNTVNNETPLPSASQPLFSPPTMVNMNNQLQEPVIQEQTINQPVQAPEVQNNVANTVPIQQGNTFKYEFPNQKEAMQPEPAKPFDNFPQTNNGISNIQQGQQIQNNNLFPQPTLTNMNNGNNTNNNF